MFTANHFIWIAICVVLIGVLLFCSLKFKFSEKVAAYIMSGIAIASELTKIFTHITETAGGGYLQATALPFHLCSILIFLIFYNAWGKNQKLKESFKSFIIPVALIGGLLAILMATSGVNFAKPFAYQCFIYHAGLIWYALHLICTKQVKLGLKDYVRNLLCYGCLTICVLWINSALQNYNVNFFYLAKPPVKGLPLLNLNNGWFVYFITIVIAWIIGVTIVHLPSIIIEAINKKKAKEAAELQPAVATEQAIEVAETTEVSELPKKQNKKQNKKTSE